MIAVKYVKPGSFEGFTSDIAPVVSYTTKIFRTHVVAQVKQRRRLVQVGCNISDVLKPAKSTRGGFEWIGLWLCCIRGFYPAGVIPGFK